MGNASIRLVALGAVATLVGLAMIFLCAGCGQSATELMQKGEEAFSQGRYERSVDLYERALEKQGDSSSGYNLLGMAYRFWYNQTGSASLKQKEVAAFRKAVELDPNNTVALVNLGATLFYSGQKREAVPYLKKALELYPDHPDRVNIEELIRQAESG